MIVHVLWVLKIPPLQAAIVLRRRRRSKKNLSVRSRDGCSEERDFGLKWIYGERELRRVDILPAG